jgi:hypothetical protein
LIFVEKRSTYIYTTQSIHNLFSSVVPNKMDTNFDNKISFYSNFSTCNIELSKNELENINIDNIDIKDFLADKLNELGIECSSRNIKLFDLQNNNEVKTKEDLLKNNIKQCKIIIGSVDCNLHHSRH